MAGPECFQIIQQPSIGTLKPCEEESVNWDDTENLFIEGDNLEVLKLLQKSYYNKVKMIYIDPPYNRGKDFIYPDKFTESLQTYLSYTRQTNAEGIKFSTNTEAEGRFHTKWMNMMFPRLFLARNLLREDGVFFVSIDDSELDNLIKLCNQIFGEENYIANLSVVNNMKGRNDKRNIATTHEFLLMYQKGEFESYGLQLSDEQVASYNEISETGEPFQWRDLRKRGGADTRKERPKMFFPLYINQETGSVSMSQNSEHTIETYPMKSNGEEGCWRWGHEKVEENIEILCGKCVSGTEKWNINYRVYLRDANGEERVSKPKSTLIGSEYSTDSATKRLRNLFPKEITDAKQYTPKPIGLLQKLIQMSTEEGDICLDFFSGTSSFADALLCSDMDDRITRHFIAVQLPEYIPDEWKKEHENGFNSIADIGKERIRRVIKKIEEEQAAKEDDLFEGDKPKQDLGFKVFKLDKSNFKIWDGEIEDNDALAQQIELAIDHIDPNSKPEDILYEILLKAGFELTTKIAKLALAGKTVYSIEDNALLICLEEELTKEVISEMAKLEPARVVCLDQGFRNNDQLKTNAVQIMKSHGVEDFRTV